MNLIPYPRYTRTVLDCEKKTPFKWIFGRAWYPSWYSSAPLKKVFEREGMGLKIVQSKEEGEKEMQESLLEINFGHK